MMRNKRGYLLSILSFALLYACASESDDVRIMHYFPDGRDFVCLNGEQRYTRALYGTATAFRLETSDRPVFAVFENTGSENNFNIAFFLDGLPLDSTDMCESKYQVGRRSYVLRNKSWGEGELKVTAMASFSEEGAIWKFEAADFSGAPEIRVVKRRIVKSDMASYGDITTRDDQRWCYEAAADDPGETISVKCDSISYLVYHHRSGMEWLSKDGDSLFSKEESRQAELLSMVEFDTPDKFINTLGSVIIEAAGGIWDGESHTWLHGASAWRMKYNGWRGGYVGDVTGWSDRSREHFREYLKSMITDVPQSRSHPANDTAAHLTRSMMEWGTPMYSNGYVCVHPGGSRGMSLYDMNLNFFDELLTHVSYDADSCFLREIWPYLVLHLDWEKRNFDPDGDHLYDAYCCIWASDALYYEGGAVTHSSAYNYRGNLLTARIAELIGEDPAPYRAEAAAILEAMNSRLWLRDEGHWAEFQDMMGLKRIHKSAALWSIYTPIDCGACSGHQAWDASWYIDRCIPHIPVRYEYDREALKTLGLRLPAVEQNLATVSESDWLPYVYSTNNIVHAEVMNAALAYFQAGRSDEGFRLLKSDIMDGMYLGRCPGNIGMGSYYDHALSEWFRDFGDAVGITSRAMINGLYGVVPDALYGRCIIRPSFPSEWQEASLKTPYLSYSWHREGDRDVYDIRQSFTAPLNIVLRVNLDYGEYVDIQGSADSVQTIEVDRSRLPHPAERPEPRYERPDMNSSEYLEQMGLSDIRPRTDKLVVNMDAAFNADVDDIYRNKYLSPRPPCTTLQIPVQGVGEWCHFAETFEIEDDGFRKSVKDDLFDTGNGLQFRSPATGANIAYTSLWDNYPDSVSISLQGRSSAVYLLMAGSTDNMQSRIENGVVTVRYTDGSEDKLPLVNPVNWCPLEQDYNSSVANFPVAGKEPYRVLLSDGSVSRDLTGKAFLQKDIPGMPFDGSAGARKLIPGGAAQILRMPLDRSRELSSLTIRTLSNDVVIGLMAVTLENSR